MISIKKHKTLFVIGHARRSMASARLRAIFVCKLLNAISSELSCKFADDYLPGFDIYIFVKKIPVNYEQLITNIRSKNQATKIFYDLCDNYFDGYSGRDADQKRQDIVSFSSLMDAIIVPSQSLKEVALRYLNASVEVIPDMTSLDSRLHEPLGLKEKILFWYLRRRLSKVTKLLLVLWFGHVGGKSISGGIADLFSFLRLLDENNDLKGLEVVAFTYKRKCNKDAPRFENLKLTCFSWSEALHPHVLSLFNYCVLPIHMDKFTLTKSSNRFVDALCSGAVVVSSPLPSYLEENMNGIFFFEDDFSKMAKRLKSLLFAQDAQDAQDAQVDNIQSRLRNDRTINKYLNLFKVAYE